MRNGRTEKRLLVSVKKRVKKRERVRARARERHDINNS